MKNLLILILSIAFFSSAHAQVKDQFETLKEIKEGTEYKEYWGIYKGDDGKYVGKPYEAIKAIKYEYNIHKKLKAYSMFNVETETLESRGSYGELLPNHYTKPSFYSKEYQKVAFLIIDGLIYELESVSDLPDFTYFKISKIFVPIKAKINEEVKEEKKEGKKKMTFKERMASLKSKMSGSNQVNAVPIEISGKDHRAVIKQYIEDMKPVMEKATANFTSEEKKEIDEIKNADAAFLAKRQADSRALAKRMNERDAKEGKKGSKKYTIKNNSSGKLYVYIGPFTKKIDSGDTIEVSCNDDVYSTNTVGSSTSKGEKLVDGDDACGKTIVL